MNTAQYAVTIVSPPGYVHSRALWEIAEGFHFSLRRMGLDSVITDNLKAGRALQIVLGAQLIHEFRLDGLRSDAIIFNSEQMDPDSEWISGEYIDFLRRHEVWDYSERNVELLKAHGVHNVRCVPIGYVPELDRIKPATQDIDVLFYGSINDRRTAALESLKAAGLAVAPVFGVYGPERDALIARSKIVLNVHFYESKIFEIARVSYLLNNGVCVVSETGLDPAEESYRGAVAFASYEGLTERCVTLVKDEAQRRKIANEGRRFMQSRPQEQFLRAALSVRGASSRSGIPSILNMGSGKDFRPDALNVDINRYWNPDIVFDFNQPLPRDGITLSSTRFGPIVLTEAHFDRIICYDVLEHLTQLATAMATCLRLLKIGGTFDIMVPYDLSWGAWQDPTHVRAFNERSWIYYTDWFWYLGWTQWRFELVSLELVLSPLGNQMRAEKAPSEIIARTPRAVDAMRVLLEKRDLTADERAQMQSLQAQRLNIPRAPV